MLECLVVEAPGVGPLGSGGEYKLPYPCTDHRGIQLFLLKLALLTF